MDTESVHELQRKDAAGWARLTAYLDAHPEGPVHGEPPDTWTSAAVYAHLARWLDHSAGNLEAARNGRPAPRSEETVDELNARWREEDASLGLTEARARAHRARERYLDEVASLPPDRWTQQLEQTVIADGWAHYDEHLRYIEAEGS